MANNMRMTVRVQGECNQQALFDVLAGQGRNVTASVGFDRGGWTALSFDVTAGEKDWGKHLSHLFPRMRLSFDIKPL